jgi:hypothetical protein
MSTTIEINTGACKQLPNFCFKTLIAVIHITYAINVIMHTISKYLLSKLTCKASPILDNYRLLDLAHTGRE